MADKIMVASGKGGVGKSTLTLGLSAGLAARGKKTLILEADTGFRGLDVALSVEDRAMYDLSDVVEGRCKAADALLLHSGGIRLLCAPNDPEYLPDARRLSLLFAELDACCDYLLVDCGAGFGPMQSRVAALCDMAVIVTVPDKVSVRAAAHVSQLLHQKGLHRQRLCINRIPKALPESESIRDLDDVIDLVGVQLLCAVPEGSVRDILNAKSSRSPATEELDRAAQRLLGTMVPLTLLP